MTGNTGESYLSRQQFEEVSGLLEQLTRSRSARVRRNSIVAWMELIGQTEDFELQKRAVEQLIDTAVTQDGGTDDDVLARQVAAEQLTLLKPDLAAYARVRLRGEISHRRGPERARRAAELALAVAGRSTVRGPMARWRSLKLMLRSFGLLERLTLKQWFLTLRDGTSYLLLSSIVMALLYGIFIRILGGSELSTTPNADIFGLILASGAFTFIMAAMISVISVPTSLISGIIRLFDLAWICLCFALFCSAILIIVSYNSGDISEAGKIIWWCFAAIFVTRLVLQFFPDVTGPKWLLLALMSWSAGVTSAYLVGTAWSGDESGAGLALSAVTAGATLVGSSWSDKNRSALRIAVIPRHGVVRNLVWATGCAGLLGLILMIWGYRERAQSAEQMVAAEILQPADPARPRIVLDCTRKSAVPIGKVVMDKYYAVESCPGMGLKIEAFTPVTTGSDNKPILYQDFHPMVYTSDLGELYELNSGSSSNGRVTSLTPTPKFKSLTARARRIFHICLGNCQQKSGFSSPESIFQLMSALWNKDKFLEIYKDKAVNQSEAYDVAMDAAAAATDAAADSPWSSDPAPPDWRQQYTMTIEPI